MFWNLAMLAALAAGNCLGPTSLFPTNQYSSDPAVRREQQLIESENLRQMHEEWRRGPGLNDEPSHLTPYRIHGGVGPASSGI